MKRSLNIFLASLALSGSILSQAQNSSSKPFVLGHTDQIKSVELSETRELNIYLPEGYSPDSAKTYPVIYLLDGSADEDFIHIVGLVQFCSFSWVNRLPPSIVVGIANTNRRRDFTYPASPTFKFPPDLESFKPAFVKAGGAPKFIAFIEKELEPYIAGHYKVNGSRTLIGQSLGGLLAAEILLEKPALFDHYIIMSPSLWWDNESLLSKAPALISAFPKSEIHVYIGVGNEGTLMVNDASKLYTLLKESGNPALKPLYEYLPNEDHGTILHQAVANAFKMFYAK